MLVWIRPGNMEVAAAALIAWASNYDVTLEKNAVISQMMNDMPFVMRDIATLEKVTDAIKEADAKAIFVTEMTPHIMLMPGE